MKTAIHLPSFPSISPRGTKSSNVCDIWDYLKQIFGNKKLKDSKSPKTFAEVYYEWINLRKAQNYQTRTTEDIFKKKLLPILGNIPFEDVTAPLVVKTLIDTVKNPRPIHSYCGWIKQLEIFALNFGYITALKLQGISQLFGARTVYDHFPSIAPEKLPEFFAKIRAEGASDLIFDSYLIGLYTLLRPGEFIRLRWSWIKGDIIHIPVGITRTKKSHDVPITPQLQRVLDRRPQRSEFILFSTRFLKHHVKRDTLAKFLREHGFKGILVPHGLRAIGRSWMAQNGIPFEISERCLSHVFVSNTIMAYDRPPLLELRRIAMVEWCQFVENCNEKSKAIILTNV